jgi:hypothetical protein
LPSPRQLLTIDAIGAAVTSALTALVLAPGHLPTGLPSPALHTLAAVAAAFCLLGVAALLTRRDPFHTLGWLALANASYCLATAALCLIHWPTLTGWAILYFAGEIAIVLTLAAVEWSASAQPRP